MGVAKRSVFSRKNGRFSGKKIAKRWFVEIAAVSDSTCEKSGLIAASNAVSAFGIHLMSAPALLPTGGCTMCVLFGAASPLLRAVMYGAATMCPPAGSPWKPSADAQKQTKQFVPRGSFTVNI